MRKLAALHAFFVLAAAAWAVEPPTEVARLAAWLAEQSATDRAMEPRSREFMSPPQVTFSDRVALEQVAVDATRTPFERMAALALLGVNETERGTAVRAFFKETRTRIAPFHVHHVGSYLSALQSQSTKDAQHVSKVTPPPRTFGAFVSTDLPLLVRMALIESDGLAMAALGLVGDEQAAEVLVHAPFVTLGDRGMCNANYQGLRFLCRALESRRWVNAHMLRPGHSSPRRAMIVLALAAERDPAALEPLSALVQALTRPADFVGDPRSRVYDPQHLILPPNIQTDDVLNICRAWGDPRLGKELAGFIYAGSGAMEEAFAAAKACGVKLAKPRLLALAAMPQPYWDAHAVQRALTPLLEADDAPAVVALIRPAEWRDRSFYTRVLWLAEVPEKVLTSQVRNALIPVAKKHSNPPVREWAIQALGRFPDPLSEQILRQAEARGSKAAMRALCKRDPDPGAAFLRRFADQNPAVREAAWGLVQIQFFGSSADEVPGGLDPDRRAVILRHLLANWPAADSPPERIEVAVQRLYMLVVDSPLNQPARRNPDLAAAVVRCANQVLAGKSGLQYAYRLLKAWNWAHTTKARKTVEQLAQSKNPEIQMAAEKVLQDWKAPRDSSLER